MSHKKRICKKSLRKALSIFLTASLLLTLTGCSACNTGEKLPSEGVISETGSEEDSSEKESKEPKSEKTSETLPENESEEPSEKANDGKTPVEIHGALSVKGNRIVDENGNNFQICGVSTHGLGWFPQYVNQDAVNSLRDDFGANTLRLAMYTAEGAGYCTGGNKADLKKLVTNGVDYATNAGMYAIIDWHILHDLDPNVYKADAKAFFDEMSKKYADNNNVLYEICNEPNGGTTWEQVKKYAEEVIPVIRANDPDAIIIVGTPNWSQDVDVAVANPIKGVDNLVYAVHFYADTHKDDIRSKVIKAEDAGYAVLISEFSICDASGNGNNNIAEADKWIALLDKYGIGMVAWNLSNKAESSSLISSGCQKTSGWTYEELSQSGKWLVGVYDTHSDQGSGLAKGKAPVGGGKTDGGQEPANDPGQGQQGKEVGAGGSGDLKVSLVEANSWKDGSATCIQYTITITNNGSAAAGDWTVTINLGCAAEINQIWGGKGSVSGNTVTITPESYNKTIAAGGSLSDVGVILRLSGDPGKVSVSVQ